MKSSVLLAASAVTLMAVSAACNRTETAVDDNTLSFSNYAKHQTYSLQGSAKAYELDSDVVFTCDVRMLMPESLMGHDVDTLRAEIFKVGFDTVGTRQDSIIEKAMSCAAAEVGFPAVAVTDTVGNSDGFYIVDGELRNVSRRTLAYAVTVSRYMPYSAHGMFETSYINYDLKEGRIFNLDELVTKEGLEKLPGLLREVATSMRGYVGPTNLEALPADDNFFVDLHGDVVFVYQPYEIASYAQGIIEVPVPAYRISDYLTPYGNSILLGTDN